MGFLGAMDFFAGLDVFICLAVGAIAGWLAGQYMRGGGYGLIANIVIGLVGGVIGGFVFDWINIIDLGDILDPVVAAVLGAAILLGLASALRPAAPTPTA